MGVVGGHNTEDLGGSKGVVLFLIRAMAAAGEAQKRKKFTKMRDQPGFFLYVWTYADHG